MSAWVTVPEAARKVVEAARAVVAARKDQCGGCGLCTVCDLGAAVVKYDEVKAADRRARAEVNKRSAQRRAVKRARLAQGTRP